MTVTLNLDDVTTDTHTRRALSEISLTISKGKKIVVVTGAGISCSCGIPDFRSSDGLYAMVKEQYPDVVLKGRDLFDASLFRDPTSTAVFYTFVSQLKRSIDAANPTPTHHFIKTLDTKKKLLRSYTQNIDGLEARVGLLGSSGQDAKSNGKSKTKIRVKDVRNVQLHGDIHRVRCMTCSAEYPCEEEHLQLFQRGKAPDCPECLSRSQARVARSARAIRVGSLRPGIVLYDETHPLGDDIGSIHTADLGRKPDMLIIMGTSLKVHGLKKLVKDFARTVHSSVSPSAASSSRKPCKVIFVNKTAPGSEWSEIIDCHISGETDVFSARVIEDWKKMKPADWEVQQTLVANGETSMAAGLKTVKHVGSSAKCKHAIRERENISPQSSPMKDNLFDEKLTAPSSPSKRRQKSSHYDDIDSSPSKRQSTYSNRKLLPDEERGMLFNNTTNLPSDPTLGIDNSKMSINLADLSIREDRRGEAMDISLVDISMRGDESIVITPQSPSKPSKLKVVLNQPMQQRPPIKRASRVKKVLAT
ncbi:DHS-like NAD/FAD-binding domain-containing protein [Pholiota conissans]|uniref:DHS-like NAD/FAD-binding domain-containing protein n=1 Tax=Pholiota conissans TaxID=109636 RepID=A0A9P5Z598_9AGAR|nr:DHS-like NAD/FAD-binding domain-containing protein [Pholiota conissans]